MVRTARFPQGFETHFAAVIEKQSTNQSPPIAGFLFSSSG
jgi:hypothetical protein